MNSQSVVKQALSYVQTFVFFLMIKRPTRRSFRSPIKYLHFFQTSIFVLPSQISEDVDLLLAQLMWLRLGSVRICSDWAVWWQARRRMKLCARLYTTLMTNTVCVPDPIPSKAPVDPVSLFNQNWRSPPPRRWCAVGVWEFSSFFCWVNAVIVFTVSSRLGPYLSRGRLGGGGRGGGGDAAWLLVQRY